MIKSFEKCELMFMQNYTLNSNLNINGLAQLEGSSANITQTNSGLVSTHANFGRNRDLLTMKDKERIGRTTLQTMPSSTKKRKIVNANGRGDS